MDNYNEISEYLKQHHLSDNWEPANYSTDEMEKIICNFVNVIVNPGLISVGEHLRIMKKLAHKYTYVEINGEARLIKPRTE